MFLAAVGLALASLAGVRPAVAQGTHPFPGDKYVSSNPYVAAGDAAYGRRQEGRVGLAANGRQIAEAISNYQTAAEAPDNLEARWKLLRALYFKGVYVGGLEPDARKAVFVQARRVADDALTILARRAGRKEIAELVKMSPSLRAEALAHEPDVAPTFYWSAVCRGRWALAAGKLEAARAGVAERIRDDAATVIALDPTFEDGGGYRVLGRLHDQAPEIPFLTGWVSRDEALKNLRLALATAPRNLQNRHFLAEALVHGGDAADRAEAIKLEESVLAEAPSPQHLVEDLTTQDQARANLAQWGRSPTPSETPRETPSPGAGR